MGDVELPLIFENVSLRRQRGLALAGAGACWLAAGVHAGLTGSLEWILDAAYVSGVLAVILIGFRAWGFPGAQEVLRIDELGISYGGRVHVPWDRVKRIERRRYPIARQRLVVIATGWRPKGLFGFLIAKSPLPLSAFDHRREWADWLNAVQRFHRDVEMDL